MHEVVKSHQLQLLHCHYAIPHAASAWIAREMLRENGEDVRVLTTLHGTDITIVGQDPSFYPITKFSIEKSDRITAVSQYLREETCRAFGCDGPDVEVIHNFIDPGIYDRAKYPPLLKNEVGGSRRILMHVSNFRTVKRVRDVIRIYAEVNREMPSVLVMIGDGPDRPAAEEEARLLGVEQSVSFLGKLDQIAPLLAAADLFLLPSQSESFGLSALEALASGVPVVGSDAGGLPEVVRDGETGALCAVGDIAGMATAALEILKDSERWKEMSRLAAADARERFSQDAIVSKYESLYRDSLMPTKS
jgi:N-acetyl-alpha-D-glucosaminyl L-malate synthase BshA